MYVLVIMYAHTYLYVYMMVNDVFFWSQLVQDFRRIQRIGPENWTIQSRHQPSMMAAGFPPLEN